MFRVNNKKSNMVIESDGYFAGGQPMLRMERSKFLMLRKFPQNSRFLVEM